MGRGKFRLTLFQFKSKRRSARTVDRWLGGMRAEEKGDPRSLAKVWRERSTFGRRQRVGTYSHCQSVSDGVPAKRIAKPDTGENPSF
jgi:hypothetical protein